MIHSLLLVLSTVLAAPVLQIEGPIVENQQVTLRLSDGDAGVSGIAVSAMYRQNAHARLQHQQDVGTTDADGRVNWIPEEAGVVVVSWEGGTRNVSVCHAGVPTSGVVVIILAGILLLGGAILFFCKMLKAEEEAEHTDEPAGTE